MDLNQLKGNSDSLKRSDVPENRELIIPESRKVKQNAGSKFLSNLFADDISNVKDYILWDVLMPALKNAISDTVTNGIDILLFGQSRSGKTSGGKFNYSGIYASRGASGRVIRLNDIEKDNRRESRLGGNHGYSYQEIALSRGEAEDVLWRLRQKESQYDMVSVSDMYDAIAEVLGEDPFKDIREFTDNKWGWTDIDRATLQRVPNGFVIRMPRVEPL